MRLWENHLGIGFVHVEVPEEELDERAVSRILSSFSFLSLHHTFNQAGTRRA